jgi:hypothetical protein
MFKKKLKLWRLPKIEDCMERWSASPFGPPREVRRGGLQTKHIGIKARCHWEHPWGTYWELIGNLKGTCWEQRKNEKNSKNTILNTWNTKLMFS